MIYYVEDDDNIRALVVYTLTQMNLPCKGFADGAAFREAVAAETPDLVLLDIMLPSGHPPVQGRTLATHGDCKQSLALVGQRPDLQGEDGLSLLRFLRENHRTADIPVIMLTAKGTEMDKVQGLDYGADDYMVKPFGMAELVARIRARLRRTAPKESIVTRCCGALTIDRRSHKAFVDSVEMPLTLKEYDLLLLLMENSGAVFTREQLLERIWDMTYDGGTRTVDVHVQTLRTKMGHCGHMIETVRGVGYRLGGEDAGGRVVSPTNERKSSDLPRAASTRRQEDG